MAEVEAEVAEGTWLVCLVVLLLELLAEIWSISYNETEWFSVVGKQLNRPLATYLVVVV